MSNSNDFVIENGVLTKYVGPGGNVVIPDGVTEIGRYVFSYCTTTLTSVTIPEGVTSIGTDAFNGFCCKNLMNIILPESVTRIASGAFSGCEALRTITLPSGLKRITNRSFSFCKALETIVIPEGCDSIGDEAFAYCEGLENVRIPASVQTIGARVFTGCRNLKEITLQEGLKTLRYRAFADCESLEAAFLPDSLKRMGYGIFFGCPRVEVHTNAGSYAERFLQEQDDDPASRKDRKLQEWKMFFCFSMSRSKGGAYVTGCYADAPLIYLPDRFGKTQAIYAKHAFREDAAFLCSKEVFKKLPLSNKYSTVRAYLNNCEAFVDTERDYLSAYAKKNQTAMISFYSKKADYDTVRLLMKLKKLTHTAMDKLLAELEEAETRMMLLAIQNEEQA